MYPIASIGQTSCRVSVMNATSPPRLSSCLLVANVPSSRTRPIMMFGIRSRPAQNVPRSRAMSSWVR